MFQCHSGFYFKSDADEIETSIHLYLQPNLVHMERAVVHYAAATKKITRDTGPVCFSETLLIPLTQKPGCLAAPQRFLLKKGKPALEIMKKQWLSAFKWIF